MEKDEKRYSYDAFKVKERVRELRLSHFKTKEEFCNKVGITTATLKKRESGEIPYKLEELVNLCNELNCDIDYLLMRQEEEKRETKDLGTITGLSEKACQRILAYSRYIEELPVSKLDRERRLQALSWFLENGLLDCISGASDANGEWWDKHDFSPLIKREEMMMKYAKIAEEENHKYTYFPTEPYDEEEEYWKAVTDNKAYKAEVYEIKEQFSVMVNEYCEECRESEQVKEIKEEIKTWWEKKKRGDDCER